MLFQFRMRTKGRKEKGKRMKEKKGKPSIQASIAHVELSSMSPQFAFWYSGDLY
jgi:hypothetical protein